MVRRSRFLYAIAGGCAGFVLVALGLLLQGRDGLVALVGSRIVELMFQLSGIPIALADSFAGHTDQRELYMSLAKVFGCVLWGSIAGLLLHAHRIAVRASLDAPDVQMTGPVLANHRRRTAVLWLVLGVPFMINWMIGSSRYDTEESGSMGLASIARHADLSGSFPSSTRVVHSYWDASLQDYNMFARLEMDRKDVPRFLSNILRKHSVWPPEGLRDNMRWDGAPSWWDPDAITQFTALEMWVGNESGTALILVDRGSKQVATVYIYVSR